MDADALEPPGDELPPPERLVATARERLGRELRALTALDGAQRGRSLNPTAASADASFGAMTHLIRRMRRAGREGEAHSLFIELLRRIEPTSRRWIASVLWSLPPSLAERREWAQDLAQELTLLLWRQIALGEQEAWELFFQRALDYAQRHVATTYLQRQGLRADARARQSTRGQALVFSRLLADSEHDDLPLVDYASDGGSQMAQGEFADLRALVVRLPPRERVAVVMRFWQQASEAEIGEALGGVTTRAVRYTLRRAYGRLRTWYAGDTDLQADAREGLDERESR